jgi:hypothetical protein
MVENEIEIIVHASQTGAWAWQVIGSGETLKQGSEPDEASAHAAAQRAVEQMRRDMDAADPSKSPSKE